MLDKKHFTTFVLFGAGFFTALLISGCLLVWFVNNDSNIHVNLSSNVVNSRYFLILSNNDSKNTQSYIFNKLTVDDETTLIDFKKFKFIINRSICNETNPFLVMLIHSAPSNFKKRHVIRETWGRSLSSIATLFLVGISEKYQIQLEEENTEYQDIIQGNFFDSYRNITYKHVMALKWVTYYCPHARYMLKLDDDVFVHVQALVEFLRNRLLTTNSKRLILCDTISSSMVKRSWRSKWRVSPKDYADIKYPRYCAGWAILYSSDVVFLLYKEAQKQPYFWIDDVHITGTLAKNINLTQTSLHSMILSENMMKLLLQNSKIKKKFFLGPPNLMENEIRALNNALAINKRT
ncbi:beta-1,3-galactosyltransferase 5 [Nasonia vitripennis]|uniref:Hexosyltransferase n=1 Tax=Nasonia vitripennis TaxID=7425 RepID=A0A7M7T984_NASVI|nr:beta-1,3-galactosyltransferase 5 [Nasonia vitripennis]